MEKIFLCIDKSSAGKDNKDIFICSSSGSWAVTFISRRKHNFGVECLRKNDSGRNGKRRLSLGNRYLPAALYEPVLPQASWHQRQRRRLCGAALLRSTAGLGFPLFFLHQFPAERAHVLYLEAVQQKAEPLVCSERQKAAAPRRTDGTAGNRLRYHRSGKSPSDAEQETKPRGDASALRPDTFRK